MSFPTTGCCQCHVLVLFVAGCGRGCKHVDEGVPAAGAAT